MPAIWKRSVNTQHVLLRFDPISENDMQDLGTLCVCPFHYVFKFTLFAKRSSEQFLVDAIRFSFLPSWSDLGSNLICVTCHFPLALPISYFLFAPFLAPPWFLLPPLLLFLLLNLSEDRRPCCEQEFGQSTSTFSQ